MVLGSWSKVSGLIPSNDIIKVLEEKQRRPKGNTGSSSNVIVITDN